MPVEFDEEKISFGYNAGNSVEAKYQQQVKVPKSPTAQISMLVFAVVCIAGAFYLPRVINPPEEEPVIYLEDLTEARMRLIPDKIRGNILLNLQSRNQLPPGSE